MAAGGGIDWAGPLIGGALALGGSALATWLQGRASRRLAADARADDRRQAQLALVTDVLMFGRAWCSSQEVLLAMMFKNGVGWMEEWFKTDTGRERLQLTKDLGRALTQAKLSVTHPRLRVLIVQFGQGYDNAAARINGPVLRSARHSPQMSDLDDSTRKQRDLGRLLDDLEIEAMHLSTQTQPRRRW